MHFITTDHPWQTGYQLMVSSILPRPIAWISTRNADGLANLAPYSFFTVASCNPPVLAITQVNPRDRAAKDTLNNLRETGECVVNIVSADLSAQMNASCADYPPHVSEFEVVGIERCASKTVEVPGVAAARVRYECKLRDVVQVSDKPGGGQMMLLDVLCIAVDETVLQEQAIISSRLNAIGKMGGDEYNRTDETFSMARPAL